MGKFSSFSLPTGPKSFTKTSISSCVDPDTPAPAPPVPVPPAPVPPAVELASAATPSTATSQTEPAPKTEQTAGAPGSPDVVAQIVVDDVVWQCCQKDLCRSLLCDSEAMLPMQQLQQELAEAMRQCPNKTTITAAQLVRVLRATKAIADSVAGDNELAGTGDSKTTRYRQLVLTLIKHQAQILEGLADDWSMSQPRCSMSAADLVQHVEALAVWYQEVFRALKRLQYKGYVKRLFTSRTKEQEQFKHFERVLSLHGDMISDLMNPSKPTITTPAIPEAPESILSPPARRTISDVIDNHSHNPTTTISPTPSVALPLTDGLVHVQSAPPEQRLSPIPSNNPFASPEQRLPPIPSNSPFAPPEHRLPPIPSNNPFAAMAGGNDALVPVQSAPVSHRNNPFAAHGGQAISSDNLMPTNNPFSPNPFAKRDDWKLPSSQQNLAAYPFPAPPVHAQSTPDLISF